MKQKFILFIWVLSLSFIACSESWAKKSSQILPYSSIPILGFHDVVDINNKYNLPPFRREFNSDYSKQNLEIFLEYLLQNNYWFLSTEQLNQYFLKQSKPIPPDLINKKPIMLTFDDGYRGIRDNLLPLLQKLTQKYKQKVKVVLFINPGLMSTVDDDLLYLSCTDLQEGHQLGFYDIQSHSLSHLNLTTLNINRLSFEILQAKRLLKKCLNNQAGIAKHFAYPYGAYNSKVIEYVGKYHASAYTYNNQAFSLAPQNKKRYQINRYQAFKNLSPAQLINKTKEVQ